VNGIDYFERGWSAGRDTSCMIDAFTGERVTYDEMRVKTFVIANALRARGYGEGAKGAVLGYNDIGTVSCFLSMMRAGIAAIPINARNTATENAQILRSFDCEVLFFMGTFSSVVPVIADVAKGIRDFVCIDGADGFVSLDDWTRGFDATEFELRHDPNRVLLIQPTGGTTGRPKGVMVANRGMENHVANMYAVAPMDGRPVFLAVAPLTHAAGYVMQTAMSLNGTTVLMSRVDKVKLLASIAEYGVTHTFLPPTVIYDLLEVAGIDGYDYSTLRYLIYGASPMSPEKIKRAIDVFGPVLCQVYGQTEASFPNTFLSAADHFEGGAVASMQRLGSCGRATPFCRLAIMSNGKLLADDEIGEIVIRSSGLMLGYYKADEETRAAQLDGWHLTGDIGYRDKDGYFHIVDRKKDMIISGGFNIYSVEVEAALLSHPAVQNCAVIGIPHDKWGEMVGAEIELIRGADATPQDIIAYCKNRLGAMKAPKQVVIVDQLPRSSVGKILKREIRKKYWENARRMVN
jgi:acyl-CoA synthetase (AMP-forming)/AMP-acid ligase II